MDPIRHARYRRLLLERSDEFIAAVAYALKVTRAEVLRRLGVEGHQLVIPPATKTKRGRPARTDLNRAAILRALRETDGAIKPAATKLEIPRMTLTRFIAREIAAWEYFYGPALTLPHAKQLHASAIAPDVAKARGYCSADGGSQLYKLGFGRANALANRAGMLIPIWNVRGKVVWHQLRVDEEFRRWTGEPGSFRKTGKQRYANPSGWTRVLDDRH